MKKITIAMMLMFTSFTPTFADFTLADLFVSGGVDRPVDTKDNKKKECDCQ